MDNREAVLLQSAVWMSLVVMSFKTTFSMKGSHHSINPYFKNLPTIVRRDLHVITIRYMEQDCTCQNHVQCDIYPTTLTCDVVLPSYQYFLQYLQQTGMSRKSSSESDALNQFGKTIQMLILARVNGYYSPYSPQTIMEEEARSRYNDVFSIAEKEFFKHRLLTLYPKVSDKDIETSINFLEQQKMVNCPCFVHTEQRGHEWIVFRRQPDRKVSDDALALLNAPTINDCGTEDEDFFSTEDDDHVTAPISDNAGKEDNIPDVSGASSGNDMISSDHSYLQSNRKPRKKMRIYMLLTDTPGDKLDD